MRCRITETFLPLGALRAISAQSASQPWGRIFVMKQVKLPEDVKFWRKVVIAESGCWEWIGGKLRGYGQFTVLESPNKWRCFKAHRWAYEYCRGQIPEGLCIDHLCRNRSCVNPWHMEVVTIKENTLRGYGITAQNARKVNCPKGHPLSGENLKIRVGRGRICRICFRASNRRRKRLKQLRRLVEQLMENY